jgi:hypothetical protein
VRPRELNRYPPPLFENGQKQKHFPLVAGNTLARDRGEHGYNVAAWSRARHNVDSSARPTGAVANKSLDRSHGKRLSHQA